MCCFVAIGLILLCSDFRCWGYLHIITLLVYYRRCWGALDCIHGSLLQVLSFGQQMLSLTLFPLTP